ncbi:MAG TPA: hypothetical protein VLS89_14820 [Candidatus Nanopelagicales bacterium]|nr:hypothetical protein [Candidatus Nanopelagicales bacterium]
MDAHQRAFEVLARHPRGERLSPRSALAVLATIHAARGGYPVNLAECIGWGIGMLERHPYFRQSVEEDGPEQWAYHLRLIGLREAQDPDFPRRMDRAAAEILASVTEAPIHVGGFIVTPQDMLDYLNRVNLSAELLNEDVRRTKIATKNAAFYWAWQDWLIVWRQFYNEHLPWHARLSGGVYDETEVKERELMEWRQRFEALGEKPTAPPPQGPGGGPSGGGPTLSDIGMTLARGAVVVAGIGVVAYIAMRRA